MTPQQLYDEVCRIYFPKWTPWEMDYKPEFLLYGCMGYCNIKERKIGLCLPSKSMLIHEICHAITTKKHGETWQRRMFIVLKKACNVDDELAQSLEVDINERMATRDTSIWEFLPQIIETVKGDANYYHNNPEALDGFLLECGIFPELNDFTYQRIRRKALRVIEISRQSQK